MDLEPIAERGGGGQDAARLFQIESAILAEHVAEQRDVPLVHPGCPGGQYFLDDEPDEPLGVAAIFRGDGVGGKKGGCQFDRLGRGQGDDGVELLDLGCRVQPVAGFGFGAGCPVAQHARQSRQVIGHEFVNAGLSRVAHGRHDAAAGVHDLHVGGPGQPLLELAGAVARPGQMGVRVDEAGQHAAAAGIDGGLGLEAGAQFGRRTDGDDAAVVGGHGPVGDEAQVAQRRAALRAVVGRDNAQLPGRMDQQVDNITHG